MRRRLDSRLFVALLLVLLGGTVGANPLQYASYEEWAPTPWGSKVAFANGAMLGAYWVAVAFMDENQGRALPRIDHLVPKGIDGATMATLIDLVYQKAENRKLPIMYIIVEWRKFAAMYSGGV